MLLDVQASAGLATLPDDATDIAGLLQRADIAMYAAKRSGAGVVAYSAELDPHDVDQLQLLAELRHAIDHDELVLHYQPKAELDSSEVLSVEALVRWVHPRHGLLQPGAFIPMAEPTGLIQPLTAWVLDQACRQAVLWRAAGRPLAVAVNISPRSLVGGDLPAMVLETLARTGLPAHLLELEITETAVMADPAGATAVLHQLAAMGIRVSLDDFGSGYTSMALLPTPPGARPQDRPRLHHRHARRAAGRRRGRVAAHAGPPLRPPGRRRGRRDPRRLGPPARARVRAGPGLPPGPPDAGRSSSTPGSRSARRSTGCAGRVS